MKNKKMDNEYTEDIDEAISILKNILVARKLYIKATKAKFEMEKSGINITPKHRINKRIWKYSKNIEKPKEDLRHIINKILR